jgi:hypothetical protein
MINTDDEGDDDDKFDKNKNMPRMIEELLDSA